MPGSTSSTTSTSTVFGVRFYTAGSKWPTNPFRFRGEGELAIEPDFVFVRGASQRSFRMPLREEHKLRRVDIVNAYASGQDVWFDVLGVKGDMTIGFSAPDRETAARIVSLLPTRQLEAFVREHEENEVFHDRIDYWIGVGAQPTDTVKSLIKNNPAEAAVAE